MSDPHDAAQLEAEAADGVDRVNKAKQAEARQKTAAVSRGPNANRRLVSGNIDINILLAFGFGVTFLSIMLGFAIFFPNPSSFQVQAFGTSLSLAAAGVGAILPGFFEFKYQNVVRAGGALALFAVVWFSQPAIASKVARLEVPSDSPDLVASKFLSALDHQELGKAFDQIDPAFIEISGATKQTWQQLYDATIRNFGNLQKRQLVGINAVETHPLVCQ